MLQTEVNRDVINLWVYFTASSEAETKSPTMLMFMDQLNALKILTRYSLSQNELHFLLGSVFGVFHYLVDSVPSGVKPRRAAYFRQGDLPPSLHHNCVLWKHQAPENGVTHFQVFCRVQVKYFTKLRCKASSYFTNSPTNSRLIVSLSQFGAEPSQILLRFVDLKNQWNPNVMFPKDPN